MQNRMQLRDEKGAAMVEFALVLPLLLVLLLGIMQFGIAFNNYITLTDAVRAGGRQATVSRLATDPEGATKAAVMKASGHLDLDPGTMIEVESDWQAGGEVVVRASYPVEINVLGKAVYSGDITSEIKERVE